MVIQKLYEIFLKFLNPNKVTVVVLMKEHETLIKTLEQDLHDLLSETDYIQIREGEENEEKTLYFKKIYLKKINGKEIIYPSVFLFTSNGLQKVFAGEEINTNDLRESITQLIREINSSDDNNHQNFEKQKQNDEEKKPRKNERKSEKIHVDRKTFVKIVKEELNKIEELFESTDDEMNENESQRREREHKNQEAREQRERNEKRNHQTRNKKNEFLFIYVKNSNGCSFGKTFKRNETLRDVYNYIKMKGFKKFIFYDHVNKISYEESDKTLDSLGFYPSKTLNMIPIASFNKTILGKTSCIEQLKTLVTKAFWPF